jgi:hypothetical protein
MEGFCFNEELTDFDSQWQAVEDLMRYKIKPLTEALNEKGSQNFIKDVQERVAFEDLYQSSIKYKT